MVVERFSPLKKTIIFFLNLSINGPLLFLTAARPSPLYTPLFHTFYGSSEDFKFRYNNHTKSLSHQHCKNDTELSKHIWDLKNEGVHYKIT